MLLLDTSVLIDSFSGLRRSVPALRTMIERGERILVTSLVLYEWLRGPRLPAEIDSQEELFPRESAIAFRIAGTVIKRRTLPVGPAPARTRNRFSDCCLCHR